MTFFVDSGTIVPPRQTWLAMDDVARVREKIDIVSLISEYVPLKKMGRNFKALCPFHSEKTPSFVVSPERQIWHCFGGCSKGGDCFSFLMEYEKLEFVEALRILAKKAGITIRESNLQRGISSKKEKIYTLNNLALEFYHYVLTKHPAGKRALTYLLDTRKINALLIDTFMLGFSPGSSNALSEYLTKKKNYKKQDLIEAGLGFATSDVDFERRGELVDFFRNRIMFPLFDHRDNVVGFSGRLLDNSSTLSKYINTRETIVYHKGSMFFGLNTAKEEIKKKDQVIVVEGEFDLLSMFKEGVKNVVAIKGTALTEDQANLLSRFTKNASLSLDNDNAGYEATKKSLEVLEKKGFTVTVIMLKNAKDPDELAKFDPFAFKKAVGMPVGIYDYLLFREILANPKGTIDSKRNISNELLPIFLRIENAIVKEHYLKKLSIELDTSYESILKEIERIEKKDLPGKSELPKKDKRLRREILEEYLVALVVQKDHPKHLVGKAKKILQDYKFEIPSYQKIIDALSIYCEKQAKFDSRQFLDYLSKELIQSFDTCFLLPLPKNLALEYEEEVEKIARELRALFLKSKIQILAANLESREKERNDKAIKMLQKELSLLIKLLSNT